MRCSEWVRNKFWALWWQMLLSIRVQSTLNHCWFVFYPQYWRKIFLSVHDQDHIRLTWLLSKNWLIVLQHCQEPWGNIKTNNTHDWLTMQAGGRIVKIQFNWNKLTFTMASFVWAMSEIIPSVNISSTKYLERELDL